MLFKLIHLSFVFAAFCFYVSLIIIGLPNIVTRPDLGSFSYLVPFINQSLKCTEERLVRSDCDQDVLESVNLMSHNPTEEFSQRLHERRVALREGITRTQVTLTD